MPSMNKNGGALALAMPQFKRKSFSNYEKPQTSTEKASDEAPNPQLPKKLRKRDRFRKAVKKILSPIGKVVYNLGIFVGGIVLGVLAWPVMVIGAVLWIVWQVVGPIVMCPLFLFGLLNADFL
ncbi:hypothetical protein BDV12DRAFT_200748 [Aspergillus spectabilis]